jgi:hypothetical protein
MGDLVMQLLAGMGLYILVLELLLWWFAWEDRRRPK